MSDVEIRGNSQMLNFFPEVHVALYTYSSSEQGDLSFNQGEYITITKKDGDWWTGTIGDRTGIFPANYVKKVDTPQVCTVDSVFSFVFVLLPLKYLVALAHHQAH